MKQFIYFALCATTFFAACEKDNTTTTDTPITAKSCKVTTVEAGDERQKISYDSNNRINIVEVSYIHNNYVDRNIVYTYTSDKIKRSDYDSFFLLNSQGYPLQTTPNFYPHYDYEYNADGYLTKMIKTTRSFSTFIVVPTTYTYANGNRISETTNTITTNYEYYTDKSNDLLPTLIRDAGNLAIQFGKNNKNLLKKSTTNGVTDFQYTYNYNSDGLVSTLIDSSTSEVLKFFYTCK